MNKPIFNPLTALANEQGFPDAMKVEAAMSNLEIGICPKCKQSMSNALLANGDSVLYCDKCRVAAPLPDAV